MIFILAFLNLFEAKYYTVVTGNTVQCELCFRKCIITEGSQGFCRVRENRDGKLYTFTYGRPCGLQIDPIELEPMYHMVPGHRNICVFTPSCNFRCKHCQNSHISQKGHKELKTLHYSPKEVVEIAINSGCKSISHSINEPVVFYEYMYEIAKLAKSKGLLTLFHSNGSISPEPLRELLKFMDGVTIDLKGFSEDFYKEITSATLEPVLNTLKIIKDANVHLEIVYLIIPTFNDDTSMIRECCKWIRNNLGKDVPLHFTRFFPRYKLSNLSPTPIRTLGVAREIALQEELNYVYIGNERHKGNNTYCPNCKKIIVYRINHAVIKNSISNGSCKFCNYEIPGIF